MGKECNKEEITLKGIINSFRSGLFVNRTLLRTKGEEKIPRLNRRKIILKAKGSDKVKSIGLKCSSEMYDRFKEKFERGDRITVKFKIEKSSNEQESD